MLRTRLTRLRRPTRPRPRRTRGPAAPRGTGEALYGGTQNRRVTVRDIAAAKARGERWPMLTAYDALTARVFDEAGIPVLLVGDSAAMVVSATTPPSRSPSMS